MRVVAVTRVWPNRFEPTQSAFNRQQFAELAKLCDLEVIAGIPHLPGAGLLGRPRRLARLSRLPRHDRVAGIPTTNMRQLYLPKLDLPVLLPLCLLSLRPHRSLIATADVVLATWAYPDACAATIVAHRLGKPCCVKVHGSDLNVFAKLRGAGAIIRRILPSAEAVVSVSRPLTALLREHEVPAQRIHLVSNGVDPAIFRPRDRVQARAQLGVHGDERLALFVGRLEPAKGVGELTTAFDSLASALPRLSLALAGKGPSEPEVRRWAATHGNRVRVLGERPLEEVATWLAACDVFVLPSWREGTPNAVLEALASGRPVVATSVGGVPDILRPQGGVMVPPRDGAALATAITDVLSREWPPLDVSATGPGTWQASAARLHEVLQRVARDGHRP